MISIDLAKALGITPDMNPDEINKRCYNAANRMESNIIGTVIKNVQSQ